MQDFILWGTIVNTAAVIGGSSIGLLIRLLVRKSHNRKKKTERAGDLQGGMNETAAPLSDEDFCTEMLPAGGRHKPFSERFCDVMMKALALCTLYIGISGVLANEAPLVLILSMAFGAFFGELLNLDRLVMRATAKLESRLRGRFGNVAEGMLSAFLLFCVGAMTINGSIMSGLGQGHSILISKSVLDFCSSIVYASAMGIGVLFSAPLVFLVQGALTCLGALFGTFLSPTMITEISAVGSLLIIGLGLNLLGVTKLKIMNLLPAMLMPIVLCPLFG